MKYTGHGDYNGVTISIFGDGETLELIVDLAKAPFNLDFRGNLPTVFAVSSTPGPLVDIEGKKGKLHFTFEEPLPAASLELRGPSFDVSLRFIYG